MGDLGSDLALSLTSDMLWTAALIAAPLIAVTTLTGLLISVLQVVTQIQEQSLSFVPKLIAAMAVLLILGGWMLATLAQFATRTIGNIPAYF
jgi:flagellar biosynthetic protein FliQ